jgi:hypothetical protein
VETGVVEQGRGVAGDGPGDWFDDEPGLGGREFSDKK